MAHMQKMGKLLKQHNKNKKERTLIKERQAEYRQSTDEEETAQVKYCLDRCKVCKKDDN